MLKTILILISLVSFNYHSYALQIQISTSMAPLAGLASMIARDKVKIVSICSTNQCPHHYSIKPNQFFHLKKSHLVIYMDDGFEVFMENVLKDNKAKVLKLSSSPELIITANGRGNWHLWLSSKNIAVILKAIATDLSIIDPVNKCFYNKNLQESLAKLDTLKEEMSQQLGNMPKPILLDDSLSYFFNNFKTDAQIKNFGNEKISLKIVKAIQNKAEKSSAKCVFVSSHQDAEKFQNLLGKKVKVVTIDTESWPEQEKLEHTLELKIRKTIELVTNDCM